MDFETTKQLTYEILKQNFLRPNSNLQMSSIIHHVGLAAHTKNFTDNDSLPEDSVEYVLDIMNLLLQQGVIRWGLNRSNANPPYMSITNYGREVLSQTEEIPHDPEGYLKSLESKIILDNVTKSYLQESFNISCK